MSGAAPLLPSLPGLAWMLWMQPLTLRDRLVTCGVTEPDGTVWHLLRPAGALLPLGVADRARLLYLRRMALLLPGLGLLAALLTAWALGLGGFLEPWQRQLQAAALGALGATLLGGFLALGTGLAYGVTLGTALGVTLTGAAGLILGMLSGGTPGSGLGLLLGLLGGGAVAFALDAARGVALGDTRGVAAAVSSGAAGGAVFGLAFRMIAMAVEPGRGGAAGTGAGLAFAVAFVLVSLRLFLYPLEAGLQLLLYRLQSSSGLNTLGFAPVLFHDLSRLPLPSLSRHILLGCDDDPVAAERVRQACQRVPGQRGLPGRLLPWFQARELESLAAHRDFAAVVKLQGEWLPGVAGAEPWLLDFREAARFLEAAAATPALYHRQKHLDEAARILAALDNQMLAEGSPLAGAIQRAVRVWRSVARQLQDEAESASAAGLEIPNPFRIEPLTPEQGELFRGREELVRRIDSLLGDPGQSFSLALVGPRRCGKTSLLLMLPKLLPDALCIFFDLQDNPLETPAAFFPALAARAREQSLRDRRLELPPFPAGPLLLAGRAWLEQLDLLAERHRILLCLDEFERLEELFPGEPRELLQLMGLLRSTIQHRRRLRLLVAGAAPFVELGPLWNDHFINLRELRIGHLERATALDLLCRPVPTFPMAAIPAEVAEAVFTRTGGQPFLLQLYGSVLVNLLNEEDRGQARLADLAHADDEVLGSGAYYFRHTFHTAPSEAREVLRALAAGGAAPAMEPGTRLWLRRRGLLDEESRLGIPVFGTWIREEAEG